LALAVSGILSGCGTPTTDHGWFEYQPPDGWERRVPPEGIELSTNAVQFVPTAEVLQTELRIEVREVTDERSRNVRNPDFFMWAQEQQWRTQRREAMNEGTPIPAFECRKVSPSMKSKGAVEAVYIMAERGHNRRFGLFHFIQLPDGRLVRVEYSGAEPHFTKRRDAVEASLKSVVFSPTGPDEPGPTLDEKVADLKGQLQGNKLWLYDGTVAGKRLTDDDLVALKDPAFAQVTDLNLIAGPAAMITGVDVTDAGLTHIRHLPLTTLSLRGTRIADAGLVHLRDLPLESLVLGYTLVTDEGLEHLTSLPLTILDLEATRVTDDGLRHLADLPLRSLSLNYAPITDAGLRHLRELPLGQLMLIGTDITGDGLRQLNGLESGSILVPKHIPPEDIQRFREGNPGVFMSQ
jgi:hypothetical protein